MRTSKSLIKISLAAFFVIGLLNCVSAKNPVVPTSKNAWKPNKTWVFMVGLLNWQDSKNFASFPQKNRRDLMLLDVLRRKGVPENQIVYLKDQAATTVEIQKDFEQMLSRTQPDDWVFVYYEGHGFKNDNGDIFLASYNAGIKNDAGWKVKSIPETIEQYFNGDHAILALDDCNSGAIVDAVKNRRSRISYAAFASTPANSSSTGNWTFTESLINGFQGEAYIDNNRDGIITFGEMAKNIYADMNFAEEQVSQSTLTGDFNEQTFLTAAKINTESRLGERIEAFDGDDWYRAIITDAKDDKFKVHYYGYEYDEDEFLTAQEIRQAAAKQFRIGESVEAESDGKWYAAHILNVKGGAHLVSYDDYDESEDEWISSDRIRRPKRKHQ